MEEACSAAPRPSHTLSVPASPLTRPLPSSSYIAATRDKSARPFDSNDIVNMAIPIAITAYTTYVTNGLEIDFFVKNAVEVCVPPLSIPSHVRTHTHAHAPAARPPFQLLASLPAFLPLSHSPPPHPGPPTSYHACAALYIFYV